MEKIMGNSSEKERRITKKHLAEVLADNSETIGKFASIFAGRGAEREDLVQEGYLAMILMLRRHSRKHAKTILKNYVKPMVRDAAAKMRQHKDIVPLSPCEDDGGADMAMILEEHLADERAETDREMVELSDTLERSFNPDELAIALNLLEGSTHREIAETLGVSQQAVSARIKRMSKTLEL
jgi:RNA polymerase sigma factor (sigma-70 family)